MSEWSFEENMSNNRWNPSRARGRGGGRGGGILRAPSGEGEWDAARRSAIQKMPYCVQEEYGERFAMYSSQRVKRLSELETWVGTRVSFGFERAKPRK